MDRSSHSQLIELALSRLADAESAFCAGDSGRHTASAQASAGIAQAALGIVIADHLTRIEEHLATIAAVLADSDARDNLASLAARVNHTGPGN